MGRLERAELRLAWANEASDFTPWLAEPENLVLLGETIGLELELEAQEAGVGPFRADILCRDTLTAHFVLVENQLERTDHSHLGQLLTYAAGLQAVTVVWIAQRFTDEHRAALDWLNSVTEDDVNFFGLEVELWRIGDSPLAPKFNLVSRPNQWTRSVGVSRDLTAGQQLQLEYWAALNDRLAESLPEFSERHPVPQSWVAYPIGRTGFHVDLACNSFERWVTVSLVLDGPEAKSFFSLLEAQKEEIEQELGEQLQWLRKPDTKVSYIRLTKRDEDYRERSRWPEQHSWMAKNLARFMLTFRDRVKALDIADAPPQQDESQGDVIA